MEQSFELIAKTFQGLEEVLAQELIELGADEVQIGRRMVSFRGDQELMYRANFCLRTAVRILKPLKHFRAKDPEEVYRAVKSIRWDEILDVRTSFVVDTTVYSTEFRNSKFVAYKVKDAIVDYFMETAHQRPNISISNPDLRLNMHIAEDQCTLSLDSSGESLHLRGYRTASVEAPINEVLAAALVKMSGWKFDTDFVDPFCGSGTLLVEAALMARNIYPGVFRKKFGFESWKDFNPGLLSRIYDDDSKEREFTHKIYGYDLNFPAVEAALANAKAAGVADCIEVAQRDIREFVRPEAPAVMITNPPYGERLRPEDLSQIYRALGEKLKKEFQGNEAWVISSREELFDALRLRPSFKIPLQNGALDCELRKYVTFEGRLEDFRGEGGIVKNEEELNRLSEHGRFRDGRKRDFSRKHEDRPEGDAPRAPRRSDDRDRRFERGREDRRFEDRRFEDRGDDRRTADYFTDDPDLALAYRNLRARHSTFERVRASKERQQHAADRSRTEDRFRDERRDKRAYGKPFERKYDRKSSNRNARGEGQFDDRRFNRDRGGDRRWGDRKFDDHRPAGRRPRHND